MSFDWMSFATGFMETTAETIEERGREARQFEQDQRAAAERNAQVIARRRAVADQVTGYANYLRSNGVSASQIQAVIASGPQAIEALTRNVQAAVRANGGRPLGASDVATLVNIPEGFTPLDMTTEEFIDQTYGLRVSPTTEEPEQFGFMDRLFGRDQMARARGRLGETPFMEGMTIQQVNEAAMQGDYQSLIPGTFASITTSSVYDPTEQGVEFSTAFDRRLSALRSSDEWALAGEDATGERRRQLLEASLDGLIQGYKNQFGSSFLADQEAYIRTIMGDEYTDALVESYASPPAEREEPARREDEAAGVQPSQTERAIPTAPQPTVSTEAPAMATPTTGETPEAPRAEDVTIPEDANTLPEPEDDATVRVSGQDYTYAQWKAMTRTERIAAGLPTSELGAQFYFNRFAAGIGDMPSIDALVGPAGTGDPEQTAAYEAMANPQEEGTLPVDDTTIALLNSHGGDMFTYLQENQPQDEEEMFMLLTKWGQENNIVMPFDKGPLIQVFRDMVLPQGQ